VRQARLFSVTPAPWDLKASSIAGLDQSQEPGPVARVIE
jgi:hypothetical protein